MENKQFLKKKKEKEKWDQVVTEFPFGSKNALILGMVLQYSSFKGQLCQTLWKDKYNFFDLQLHSIN